MVGVGTCQRGQDARGGRDRETTLGHGVQQRLGQALNERQAAVDPTDIAPDLAGHLPLGLVIADDQLAHHAGLFDGLPGASLHPGQHPHQGLVQRTLPQLHPGPR